MATHRTALPQLGGDLFLTDGGLETTLVFHEGIELPSFAAFPLLEDDHGVTVLRKYFDTYASLANRFNVGMVLDSVTWRASSDWGETLGYTRAELAAVNQQSIRFLEEIRQNAGFDQPAVISGCIGPRGDGYTPGARMSAAEAEAYHREQIEVLAGTSADMLSAMTLNYADEAAGIALAAKRVGMPVAISFTVETDGNLPSGETLRFAIEHVDDTTDAYPCYYMINCAHPTHFDHVLSTTDAWVSRVRGLRANASCMSHAELNDSPCLDTGDPAELESWYARLKARLPHVNVVGGCCGTDHRHVEQIARACINAS